MLRLVAFVVLVASVPPFAMATPSRGDAPRRLAYSFRPVRDGGPPRVAVELRFEGDGLGKTTLQLPSSWASEQELYRCITNLRVLTPGATIADTDKPEVKIVSHLPKAELRVAYELAQDVPGTPHAGRGAGYRPVVQPEYFQFIGNTALVAPDWEQTRTVDVSMEWADLPEGWSVANSFGAKRTRQTIHARLEEALRAVYAAGDFRVVTVDVRGKPVAIAIRGAWAFTDAQFTSLVGTVVGAERAFWGDDDEPYYFVSVMPLDRKEGEKSIGGTGLTASFAVFMTTNATLEDVTYLLAHEYFHNWNDQKIGRLADPEAQLYWFSEGFTDYYTYLLLRRAGLLTFEQYVARVNEVLRGYTTSPARNVPNDRVVKDFFTDEAVSKQPYWRGSLLAMIWDARIRKATAGARSLDDVMHDMFAQWRRDRDRTITADVVDAHVRKYLPQGILEDVRRYVTEGATLEPPADLLGPPAVLEQVTIPSFELGVDLDGVVKRKAIEGVVPGSAAERAGLRDGQAILRRKPIHLNDPDHEVEITVKDGEAERTIVYLPRSASGPKVPQFVLRGAGSAPTE